MEAVMQGIMMVIRENLLWFALGAIGIFFFIGNIGLAIFFGYALALINYRRRRNEEVMFIERSFLFSFVIIFVIDMLFGYSLVYTLLNATGFGVAIGFITGNGLRMRGI